ncbi:UDP-glycosyltransferase UGT5 [Dendroctonus ponderosae]|uniref:UDP-glucuronosyltransferase n=2 Tax=Dendroctonus ponderosae TaxID=77166 RepID=A0AAR5QCA4_DENPD|nr:UDP-glycosyltransferase UGT5 [Dendroctonus ponderosae]
MITIKHTASITNHGSVMKQFSAILLLLGFFSAGSEGLRLLLVFPPPYRSHYILGNALGKGLARLGHNVTLISYYKDPNPPPNFREIVVDDRPQIAPLSGGVQRNMFEMESLSPYAILLHLTKSAGPVYTEPALNHTKVRALLASEEQFDAVIVEQFFNDALKYFAHHFQAPLIVFSTVGSNRWVNKLVANPENPSYVPDVLLSFSGQMTFQQRLYNLVFGLVSDVVCYRFIYPQQDALLRKHYPEAPPLETLLYNVSLVLINSHESINEAAPLVPNMVHIGGFHIDTPKELPPDLKEFMDGASKGVIYFSLGSNLNAANMPKEKQAVFLEVLRNREEKVLWKWDGDVFEDQPSNVKISKWFPQQAVLAHPNCKLFISHGGLLSTTETVSLGVPVLAIPIFADQKLNAGRIQAKGFGLTIPFSQMTRNSLNAALDDLLDNPKYRRNVQMGSRLLHDRPIEPMALADYWIRYVVRHKGAHHLRVAGTRLPLFRYFMLDQLGVFLGVLILAGWLLSRTRRVFSKSTLKAKEE